MAWACLLSLSDQSPEQRLISVSTKCVYVCTTLHSAVTISPTVIDGSNASSHHTVVFNTLHHALEEISVIFVKQMLHVVCSGQEGGQTEMDARYRR